MESKDVREAPHEVVVKLEDVVKRLTVCTCDLERFLGDEFLGLMLFGSWARGEAEESSDVDVFIVLRSLRGFEARSAIYSVLAKCVKRALTLIDVRADELFREELELTPLLLNILVDGIVIYDKTGKLGELASKVRQFVNSMGLVRYRTPDGKYGWKRLDGKPLISLQSDTP